MRKIFLGLMVVCFVMMTAAAYAFNPAHVEQLKKTKSCPNCDLSGADLRAKDLKWVNLSGTNLSGANLSGASLRVKNLSGANLSGTNLSGADLTLANLYNANLSGANLKGANLDRANLYNANLSEANLSKSNLSGAHLVNTDMSKATLNNADLSGAKLGDTNMNGAILSDTKGIQCDFSSSSDVNAQKCFGGSGPQCGDPKDPFHGVKVNNSNCTATAYVTIGSIMHDNCCLNNPQGYMCKEGDSAVGGNDQQLCGFEWNKAFYDSRDGRGWEVTMGPYVKGGKTDDLRRVDARDGRIYDKNGNNRRMWVMHRKNPGNKTWNHAIWKDVKETVTTQKLKAPKGTKFQEQEDQAFCASGRWAAGQCQ